MSHEAGTALWKRANEVFERALDLPADERSAWLDEACAGQPDLRAEVERRVRADADAEADAFLGEPVAPVPGGLRFGTDDVQAPMPTRLGRYRILRAIGRGGMGTVYAAERDDDTFDRVVAIKVINTDAAPGEVARRLRNERRILARLEHPNIARVYDGGETADGQPYFVMEHVAGVPIDRYCVERALPLEDRLALMRQVCVAVDYAHRNLVVHRDLKPSNILVTDDDVGGTIKLLDFGIAKVLVPEPDDAVGVEVTAPWRQRLTLPYASPEQIRGEPVSTASDVYALGVLLYRLLTGTMPRRFEGLTPWEVEQHIATSEVARPSTAVRHASPTAEDDQIVHRSTHAHRLTGDLDAIVLKALRSDPEARYRSAGSLSDDLERFSAGFPVGARRGSVRYRLGKLLRRHRLAAVMAVALFSLGLVFVATTVASAHRLSLSQTRLLAEQEKLRSALGFLRGVFEDAGPFTAEGIDLTVREAVDRQAERLDGHLDDQPEVLASMLDTLGWVYLDLGVVDQALAYHERALDVRRSLAEEDPAYRRAVAESLDGVGAALREQWQLDQADETSTDALNMHRAQSTADVEPLLRSLNQRVKLLCYREDWSSADPLSAEALALGPTRPDDPEHAKAIVQRAQVVRELGRLDEARTLYLQAEAAFRERFGPRHPIFAALYNNLGAIEREAKRVDQAIDYWQRADAQYAEAFGDDFYDRVLPLYNQGRTLIEAGRLDEAEAALGRALEVATRSPALGPEHELRYFGAPALALAGMWAETGRCDEVVALLGPRIDRWAERSTGRTVQRARDVLSRCGHPSEENRSTD